MPHLTKDEEYALVTKAQAGDDESRNELVNRNMGFIYQRAIRFCKNGKYVSEELIGEAVIGYMIAIKKFDISRNFRLNTFADQWIRNRILQFVCYEDHLIPVPRSVTKKSSQKTQDAAKNAHRKFSSLSLENSDEYHQLVDARQILDQNAIERIDRVVRRTFQEIDTLPERWKAIILDRLEGKILKDIGQKHGITKERVRQIETQAIEYLRTKLVKRRA